MKPTIRVPSNLSGPAFTRDGLVNFASRLGTGADKSSHARYTLNYMDLFDLEAAYRTTWFRKICDIPPFDETREWRTWLGIKPAQVTAIDALETELGLAQKLTEARTLARKDGGSAIVIGGDLGSADQPIGDIGKGTLKYLSVLSRWEITPHDRQRDPREPYYNEPAYYTINGDTTRIHPSRVVRFIGNPIRMQGHWDGWGESIWAEISQKVKDADRISAGIAAGVDEWKLDVYKLKNLAANLSTGPGEDLLVRRFSAVNAIKSAVNATILDAEDEYVPHELAFSGLTDIQMAALGIMAGIADIPATRLLGRSPQGMNATGDSDMRNYYDRIRAGQKMFLTPAIKRIDDVLIVSALGSRPKTIYHEWNPLYQLSETEAATVEKTMADAANVLVSSGLVPDTVLTKIVKGGIIERGQWPDAESAYQDADAEGDEPGVLAEPTEAEMAEEEARTAIALAAANDPGQTRLRAANDARFAKDAAPRTMYIRRDVINAGEITLWAKSQGFTNIVPDMHVTIAYSKTPVDWFKVGTSWSEKVEIVGGPRQMEKLGPTGEYAALLIPIVGDLAWRHEEIREKGASWDWPDYQPHISIQVGGEMPDNVTPYQGKIVLGPEVFEEVRED